MQSSVSKYDLSDFRFYTAFRPPKAKKYKCKAGTFDNNIYTFDIETISLFEFDGEMLPFNYDLNAKYYKTHDKQACCYLWSFGADDKYYYGRELDDFKKVLLKLSDQSITKFIYVHNLEYETQWLLDIIVDSGWHISRLCAKQMRQPVSFHIDELNITFRCSYQLTNLSLKDSALKYTDLEKAVGELDYNIPYSPLSVLPDNVLYYSKMDVKVLTHIIMYFRDKYKTVKQIPLTQTGEVRRSLQEFMGFWYIKSMQQLVSPIHIYMALCTAFAGGICHGNILYVNRVVENCWSFDFCSSYPYVLCCFKLPSTPFRRISYNQSLIYRKKDTHSILYHVKFTDLKSKYYNHYIPHYKMINIEGHEVVDNGRLHSLTGTCEMILCDVDLDMIMECYDIGNIEYLTIFASYKTYLDKKMIEYIVTRYSDKTTLKNVEGDTPEETEQIERFYQKQKQELNAIFGISSQNILKNGIEIDTETEDIWSTADFTEEFIQSKLDDLKKSYSTLFFPMIGAFICAIARTNLFKNIIKLDKDVVYYDTDSIKGKGDKVYKIVEDYNKVVEELLIRSSKYTGISLDKYKPLDKNGVCHPLGYFENETPDGHLYKKLKTLGAKKYMYEDWKGEKHLTMSGVRKGAVDYLDFDTFCNGTVLSYKATEKLLRLYNDNQPSFQYTDIDGNLYTCHQKHSIILQPTTFEIGQTDVFLELIAEMQGYIGEF